MTPEHWSRLNQLLDQAMAHAPSERSAFLDQACTEPEIRREVEELLSFDQEADHFLVEPAICLEQIVNEDEVNLHRPATGGRIGPYRVVELLGRGGMGEVYLVSRIDDFEQQAALKLLPQLETRDEVLRRFRAERQIQARLEHPHISRLLDGGATEDGRPYFVMEYVDGQPIDAYCDRHKLSIARRLSLFRKVCAAVHYAHQQLVVHRDLKPSNILVTASGEPKLLDFGIAKLLGPEDRFETLPGSSPMTLRYASPEQVQEESISTASDIYALGTLLYRLLSGRLPLQLDTAGTLDAIRRISAVEPEPPSQVVQRAEEAIVSGSSRPAAEAHEAILTPDSVAHDRSTSPRGLHRGLRGDLDAIVLKALRKVPDERYGSAHGLALDLSRYLHGEPVTARRGTFFYLVNKFVRRYRWSVAGVVLLLAVALSLASLEWRRLEAERARLEKVATFLDELFYSVAPDERQGHKVTAKELLDRGSVELEAFADEPELYATLAGTLGRIHSRLGHLDDARELLAESLRVWRLERPGDSPELARRLSNLGVAYRESGFYAEAEQHYREALEVRRRLGRYGLWNVKTMNNLAGVLALRGAVDEAEALYRQGLEFRRQAPKPDPTAIATSLRLLGWTLYLRGELAEADDVLQQSLELRVEHFGPQSTAVASVAHLLARVKLAKGDLEAADALLGDALSIRRQRLGDRHLAVAQSRLQLAAVLLTAKESPDTVSVLVSQALETLYLQKPAGDWEIAVAESLLGAYLDTIGRVDEAEACLRSGLEDLEATRGLHVLITAEARVRLDKHLSRRTHHKKAGDVLGTPPAKGSEAGD